MHQVVAFYLGYDKMELSALGHLAYHLTLGITAYMTFILFDEHHIICVQILTIIP